MRSFWLFGHLLGAMMWVGGGLAAMHAAVAGNRLERSQQGVVSRLIAAIYARSIAPGAALSVLSGVFLSLTYMGMVNRGEMRGMISPWLMVMQASGIFGAGIVLAVTLPAVNRLARLDPVAQGAQYDALRARQRISGMIATSLAVLGLLASALYR